MQVRNKHLKLAVIALQVTHVSQCGGVAQYLKHVRSLIVLFSDNQLKLQTL